MNQELLTKLEKSSRDIFPLFVEEYNTTTLVSDKTQIHMLKGCVEEYKNLHKGTLKYLGGDLINTSTKTSQNLRNTI